MRTTLMIPLTLFSLAAVVAESNAMLDEEDDESSEVIDE